MGRKSSCRIRTRCSTTAWASCTAGCRRWRRSWSARPPSTTVGAISRCTPHPFGSIFYATSAAAPNPVMSEPLCGSAAAAGSQRHRRSAITARRRHRPASPPTAITSAACPRLADPEAALGGFIRRSGYLRKWLILGITIGIIAGLGRRGLLPRCCDYAGRFLLGLPRRLRRADGVRRRRRARGSTGLRPTVGHPADHVRRRAGVGVHRRQVRAGGRGSRHRQRDRGRAHRPAGDPGARGAGEDGVERADDRLRRLGAAAKARPRRSRRASARCSPGGWTCPTRTAASRCRWASARASVRSSARRSAARCWRRRSSTARTSTTAR